MPDLERVTDELRENMATTPEDKSFERGFTAGKSAARKHIAIMAAFTVLIFPFAWGLNWVAGWIL